MSDPSRVGLRRRQYQPDDLRQRRITIRLSEAEWQVASTGARQDLPRPMAVGAWVVQQAMKNRDAPTYASPKSALTAELTALRRLLVELRDGFQQEKRDLVGIATNLNQATMRANSTQSIGWIVEQLPGIHLLRDELAVYVQRVGDLISRCDRALP